VFVPAWLTFESNGGIQRKGTRTSPNPPLSGV
jgi:hypothetical protein